METSIGYGKILEHQNVGQESLGYNESKHHKPEFEECLKLANRRKQSKVQWLHNPK